MYLVGLVLVFVVLAAVGGFVAYWMYRRTLRKAKGIERGLKMVPILIHLPAPSADVASTNRDVRDVMREKLSQAEVLYSLIAGTAKAGFMSRFYGQRHISLEIVASGGLVHFYAAVPVVLVPVVEQAIITAYPGARTEEAEDHNIFSEAGRLPATMGGEMLLKSETFYPLQTFKALERDPMESITNGLASLKDGEGAAIQILIRPASPKWIKQAASFVSKKRKMRGSSIGFTASDLAMAAVKTPDQRLQQDQLSQQQLQSSTLERNVLDQVEEKTKHAAYESLIRVVVSSSNVSRSQAIIQNLATTFALFDAPGMNGFKFAPASDAEGLVTAFIFRFFPPEIDNMILNTEELATIFHLPDNEYTPTTNVERLKSKQVDGPPVLLTEGLLFGYNEFRGVRKEIRLGENDRRRHTYIVGQTGSGKSVLLENLAVQDMLAGNGFAFIDPHGDTAEKLLGMVPKERAEDVIYFNPADMDHPFGVNLFEFTDPSQKDFLVQECINMLYKLYDPTGSGIIGPRFEHWFRMAALTLMADPNGATYIEIPKVFTDAAYLKNKFKYLTDPVVIDFWTKEMAQTSDYHKSEMLGWFVSKFGAIMSNEMMRNIVGQTKSAFNLREIMDQKKILIVNLSKGQVGEMNAKLLGMIFVIKFQAAAMSRANVPEEQRPDFCLYVDEFQNFSTDSFASILSEARKYRLNLIVANQFIGQLTDPIRDAVFGNVGTIVSFRTGPEDADFLVKQFTPIFDARDLINLQIGQAATRLLINGLPSQPFSMATLGPLNNFHAELAAAVKQLSAAKFGIPKAQVEADIIARMSSPAPVATPQSTTPPPPPPAPAPKPLPSTSAPTTVTPPPAAPTSPPVAPPSRPPVAPPPVKPSSPSPSQPPAPLAPPASSPLAPPEIKAAPAAVAAQPAVVVPSYAASPPPPQSLGDVLGTTPKSKGTQTPPPLIGQSKAKVAPVTTPAGPPPLIPSAPVTPASPVPTPAPTPAPVVPTPAPQRPVETVETSVAPAPAPVLAQVPAPAPAAVASGDDKPLAINEIIGQAQTEINQVLKPAALDGPDLDPNVPQAPPSSAAAPVVTAPAAMVPVITVSNQSAKPQPLAPARPASSPKPVATPPQVTPTAVSRVPQAPQLTTPPPVATPVSPIPSPVSAPTPPAVVAPVITVPNQTAAAQPPVSPPPVVATEVATVAQTPVTVSSPSPAKATPLVSTASVPKIAPASMELAAVPEKTDSVTVAVTSKAPQRHEKVIPEPPNPKLDVASIMAIVNDDTPPNLTLVTPSAAPVASTSIPSAAKPDPVISDKEAEAILARGAAQKATQIDAPPAELAVTTEPVPTVEAIPVVQPVTPTQPAQTTSPDPDTEITVPSADTAVSEQTDDESAKAPSEAEIKAIKSQLKPGEIHVFEDGSVVQGE